MIQWSLLRYKTKNIEKWRLKRTHKRTLIQITKEWRTSMKEAEERPVNLWLLIVKLWLWIHRQKRQYTRVYKRKDWTKIHQEEKENIQTIFHQVLSQLNFTSSWSKAQANPPFLSAKNTATNTKKVQLFNVPVPLRNIYIRPSWKIQATWRSSQIQALKE